MKLAKVTGWLRVETDEGEREALDFAQQSILRRHESLSASADYYLKRLDDLGVFVGIFESQLLGLRIPSSFFSNWNRYTIALSLSLSRADRFSGLRQKTLDWIRGLMAQSTGFSIWAKSPHKLMSTHPFPERLGRDDALQNLFCNFQKQLDAHMSTGYPCMSLNVAVGAPGSGKSFLLGKYGSEKSQCHHPFLAMLRSQSTLTLCCFLAHGIQLLDLLIIGHTIVFPTCFCFPPTHYSDTFGSLSSAEIDRFCQNEHWRPVMQSGFSVNVSYAGDMQPKHPDDHGNLGLGARVLFQYVSFSSFENST